MTMEEPKEEPMEEPMEEPVEEITLDNDEIKDEKPDFNIFVGAETGLLKGVCIDPKLNLVKNFSNMHSLEKKHEITAMSWGDEQQNEILLGLRGQVVRTFDSEDKSFTSNQEVTASGKIVGIARVNDAIVVASESGVVQLWREPLEDFNTIEYEINQTAKLKADNFKDEEEKEKHKVSLKVDRSLVKMRKVPGISNHFIATGGKEHDLQIWDLNQIKSGPVFRAKNVPTDSLELRVPIWVTDMCFPDNISKDKVATVSRHGHIRLYDTKGHQRRPVLSMEWPDEVLTAVSSTPCDHDILVGTATGHIAHYDIRMTHKGMRGKYRGCTGGIRSINCHPTRNVFAAVGLDRFLRIFDIYKAKPIQKMYLKSRLNHVLMTNAFDPSTAIAKIEKEKPKSVPKKVQGEKEIVVPKEEGEEFWAKLPILRDSGPPKRKKVKNSV